MVFFHDCVWRLRDVEEISCPQNAVIVSGLALGLCVPFSFVSLGIAKATAGLWTRWEDALGAGGYSHASWGSCLGLLSRPSGSFTLAACLRLGQSTCASASLQACSCTQLSPSPLTFPFIYFSTLL